MALTHVELYEALKGTVSDEAARLIAEVVPPAGEIVTKTDLLATKADLLLAMNDLRSEMSDLRVEMSDLRGEMHAETNRTIRWMLGFLISAWAATAGAVFAIVQAR